MMALVWNIMNNLGEIAVYLPLKGATIPYFVERFVEPSLAFAAGWNYWYAYAILVAGMSSCSVFVPPSKYMFSIPTVFQLAPAELPIFKLGDISWSHVFPFVLPCSRIPT